MTPLADAAGDPFELRVNEVAESPRPAVVGLLLAAGAGVRLGLGHPKALVTDSHGRSWLARSLAVLADGGVKPTYVVVGADADRVRRSLVTEAGQDSPWRFVEAADWAQGMGASLHAGLGAVAPADLGADAVIVTLVDTPGVSAAVVRRLAAAAAPDTLARAAYDGEPGHPVLLGSDHWAGVLDVAHGDRGARDYLRSHRVQLVECGDIGSGRDVDTPEALDAWLASDDSG